MSTIRVAWGTGTGPTEMSSYDAALADANLHNYNLVAVSSVIPADTEIEAVGTAPDLGPAGERLTVVQARATCVGPGRVSAALGWSTSDGESGGEEAESRGDESEDESGPGLFYEAADETDPEDVAERVRTGLAAGRELRDWAFTDERIRTADVHAEPGTFATAVVVAAYGESEPIC
ncbi:pyruvoyl-dependent arginine decarboxylase [Halorussus gelatinilyticus]|uniref:arginine decarboxylase n=1 Tax=Halorussus gelatinilyticus TaxID=2937524 RepID=A0A8U0IJN8_9EURY|nr:pyruvoyl-dependent arginine decarboxylase [Halorussus gelatinilyticus]UPW01330.1 pyruvoyl-dependent arginine decarboxylase [Halorussus gelatinilyticus]